MFPPLSEGYIHIYIYIVFYFVLRCFDALCSRLALFLPLFLSCLDCWFFFNRLYRNIHLVVIMQDLGAIFGNFGKVLKAILITDDNEESKGYGFVNVRAPRPQWFSVFASIRSVGPAVTLLLLFYFFKTLHLTAKKSHMTEPTKNRSENERNKSHVTEPEPVGIFFGGGVAHVTGPKPGHTTEPKTGSGTLVMYTIVKDMCRSCEQPLGVLFSPNPGIGRMYVAPPNAPKLTDNYRFRAKKHLPSIAASRTLKNPSN